MTVSVTNPISGLKTTRNTLKVTIIVDCNLATLVDKTFNDMTIKVTQTATQDIKFEDTMGQAMLNYAQCGPRVYTFTPSQPAFLTMDSG